MRMMLHQKHSITPTVASQENHEDDDEDEDDDGVLSHNHIKEPTRNLRYEDKV